MKLYATISNERRKTRPAKKGADDKLDIQLTKKGVPEYQITYTPEGLKVEGDGGILLETAEPRKA